jgi:hypothetical protein
VSTSPMFAPDGTVRQVPAEQLTDALNAGGKRAVQMTDPSGTLRYVPEDQVNTAMQSGGKVSQPAPSFWQDPKSFLQNQSQEMGQAAQNQMNQALGPESQGKSLLSRMGHATLSYLPAAASTVEGMASGLVGTDAGTWKNAAMVAAGAIDPAIPGAYFATQGTGQLTGLTPGVNPGDLSPGNVQNALLAGASVAGGASAAGAPTAGATLKAGPPIARTAIKTANTVLNKAPELVLGGAGAALGGYLGGGTGAGIGGTIGAIAGRSLPKMGRIPGENFGLSTTAAPDSAVAQSQPLNSVPTPQTVPAAQSGEALGQIPQAQPAPQTPTAQPVQPAPSAISQPAPMLQLDTVENSSQIAGHAYDPQSLTATIQFKNGQLHQYANVSPQDWDGYRAASSPGNLGPGKAFNQFIKRDPATGTGRMSRPLTANSPKSTVQEAPPATANELLERYVGLF